ncbi:MAG: Uncharacterised protein [Cyanobium sp. ARS6]|nr:MAG: Uncharacterised protein [Cyanobium sp. ARS6]
MINRIIIRGGRIHREQAFQQIRAFQRKIQSQLNSGRWCLTLRRVLSAGATVCEGLKLLNARAPLLILKAKGQNQQLLDRDHR